MNIFSSSLIAILTDNSVTPENPRRRATCPDGASARPTSLYDVASLENDIAFAEKKVSDNPGSSYWTSELEELRGDLSAISF